MRCSLEYLLKSRISPSGAKLVGVVALACSPGEKK
jgi:hypothetical protein